MRKQRRRLALGLATVAAGFLIGACADLDLGPLPDNAVRPGARGIVTETGPVLVLPSAIQPTVTPPSTTTATAPATHSDDRALLISVQDALLIALEHNTGLQVQRYNPLLSRTAEEQQKAVFEPGVNGQIAAGRTGTPAGGDVGSRSAPPHTGYANSAAGNVNVQQFFPTGTTVTAGGASTYSSSEFYSDTSTRLGVTVNQALLRGAGLKVNLASLRQAQLDTKISQYELRAVAESLVAQVEQTYWDYALAVRQIEIFQNSLKVAQQQLDQTNELIRVGKFAENERAAAESEVALRRVNLINAKANLETTRLTMLQLINPGKTDFWDREVTLKERPFIPQGTIEEVQAHVDVALARRPDLNQARLQIKRGDLQIIKTKNGLLPQMNLFVNLGKTGYSRAFGGTIPALNGPDYDALVGMQFDISPLNTAARASYRQSVLSKEQLMESLDNLTQLAQVDVRSAFIDVNRLRAQITATTATRVAQEATYHAEAEKFRVGKSTALLVAQTQRDLVQAQILEVQAIAGFLKSLVTLYQQDGSLLERRGIQAPGAMTALK